MSFNGRKYILEEAVTGNFAIVKGLEGGPVRQRHLPAYGTELQSHGCDRGPDYRGRSGTDRGTR